MKLLIVDDDHDCCTRLKENLAEFGRIDWLDNIKAAIQFADQYPIDLLITAYKLPDGNGLELIRLLRNKVFEFKSILISKDTTTQIAIDSVNMQISALIEKPFNHDDFKETVRGLLIIKKIKLCEKDHLVMIDDFKFSITPTEFKIFKILYDHPNKRLSRKAICEKVWGSQVISDNSFDTHLGNIKKKMGPYSNMLTNIKGVGYSLSLF